MHALINSFVVFGSCETYQFQCVISFIHVLYSLHYFDFLKTVQTRYCQNFSKNKASAFLLAL